MDKLEARYRKNHRDITALTGYENNPGMLYDPTDEKLATAIKNNNDYINKVYNDSINRELDNTNLGDFDTTTVNDILHNTGYDADAMSEFELQDLGDRREGEILEKATPGVMDELYRLSAESNGEESVNTIAQDPARMRQLFMDYLQGNGVNSYTPSDNMLQKAIDAEFGTKEKRDEIIALDTQKATEYANKEKNVYDKEFSKLQDTAKGQINTLINKEGGLTEENYPKITAIIREYQLGAKDLAIKYNQDIPVDVPDSFTNNIIQQGYADLVDKIYTSNMPAGAIEDDSKYNEWLAEQNAELAGFNGFLQSRGYDTTGVAPAFSTLQQGGLAKNKQRRSVFLENRKGKAKQFINKQLSENTADQVKSIQEFFDLLKTSDPKKTKEWEQQFGTGTVEGNYLNKRVEDSADAFIKEYFPGSAKFDPTDQLNLKFNLQAVIKNNLLGQVNKENIGELIKDFREADSKKEENHEAYEEAGTKLLGLGAEKATFYDSTTGRYKPSNSDLYKKLEKVFKDMQAEGYSPQFITSVLQEIDRTTE